MPLLLVCSLVAMLFSHCHLVGQETIQFNRDVRPILSDACFRCHGFDSQKREAELRLDQESAATSPLPSGNKALVPGSLSDSELYRRIISTDVESVMPPASAHRQLSDAEKETIRKWIEQGASYQGHWSFEPIVGPPIPDKELVGAELWQGSPIDRFLWLKMRSKGLAPQPPADRPTLLRRVSFALTGLPPTLEEMTNFESDTEEGAYERMVDRYLESEAFGEEMAKHWLDVARYGDTHGLHLDNDRQIWAYRDWVVQAFNRNMPFSQFTREQLAGDLLPNPSLSQLTATGFNRCNVTTSEGGAIEDEFLFRYAVDRTSTTIQTWLGLTGGCAVCHDHKYDPLTMNEFYSMYSFFYSAADPAMDGNIENTQPFLAIQEEDQVKEYERLKKVVSNAKRSLLARARNLAESAEVREENAEKTDGSYVDALLEDEFPIASSLRNTSRNAARWSTRGQMPIASGKRALRLEFGDKYEQVISGGLVPHTIPESPRIEALLHLDRYEPAKAVFLELRTDKGTKRWVWTNEPEWSKRVDSSPQQVMGPLPEPGKWMKLTVADDRFGLPTGAIVQEWKLGLFNGVCHFDAVRLVGSSPSSNDLRSDLTRWWSSRKDKDTPTADGPVNDALKAGPDSELGKSRLADVRTFYLAWIANQIDETLTSERRNLEASIAELTSFESSIPGTMIFRDRGEPRAAHVMKRGQYTQPGDPVQPNTPAILPKMKLADASRRANRLDLANWLLDDENPLVARVTVNRFWQQLFGVGIVKTSEDFGNQGQPPVHPELLDYLALRFRKDGWNVKGLIRELICSQAFRQSAVVTSEAIERDPENRYLARGPRMRLDAEQIRDNALAVSGLLNRTMGGPGDKIYQPPNIWEPVGYGDSNTRYYLQDHGERLYRRSVYAYIKRTAPPPFMTNFDAPNREMSCSRRERSNTPLQALQLMNDVQHVEAARKLAERTLREGGVSQAERRRFLFRVVTARYPDEMESQVLDNLLQKFYERFRSSSLDAEQLLSFGESTRGEYFDSIELAAYTLLANTVLNLDETVNRN